MNEAAHWTYIAIAYGVTVLVIGASALRIVLEHWRLRKELDRFEAKSASEQDQPS